MKGDKGERVSDGFDFIFIHSLDSDFSFPFFVHEYAIRNSGVMSLG